MSQHMMLDSEDRQTSMGYPRDGLGELFAGSGLLVFGLGILIDIPWLGAIFPAMLLPVWQSLRRSLIAPRLRADEVVSPEEANGNTRVGLVLGTASLLLGILFFALMSTDILTPTFQTWFRAYFALLLGLVGAFFCVLGALLTGIRRLYAYAALVVAIFGSGQVFGWGLEVSMASTGVVFLLVGAVLLRTFLRQHPKAA